MGKESRPEDIQQSISGAETEQSSGSLNEESADQSMSMQEQEEIRAIFRTFVECYLRKSQENSPHFNEIVSKTYELGVRDLILGFQKEVEMLYSDLHRGLDKSRLLTSPEIQQLFEKFDPKLRARLFGLNDEVGTAYEADGKRANTNSLAEIKVKDRIDADKFKMMSKGILDGSIAVAHLALPVPRSFSVEELVSDVLPSLQPLAALPKILEIPGPHHNHLEEIKNRTQDILAKFSQKIEKLCEFMSTSDDRDGYFRKDISGTYVEANPAMGHLLSVPCEEIIGKKDRDLYSPSEVAILEEAHKITLQERIHFHEQTRFIKGEPKRFSEVFRTEDSCGRVNALAGISREVPFFSVEAVSDSEYPSPSMSRLLGELKRIADSSMNVLLLGETGSGKSYFAKYVHEKSKRSGAFIHINCAAIPDNLIESELFGHEKWAFTGAMGTKIGLLEAADGGTVFLDEIGDVPLTMQAKLLTFLDDKQVRKIGSNRTREVDVRIIAATNKDLRKEIVEKRFREDLFYRLNVFNFKVPSLKERLIDIPILTNKLLNKLKARHSDVPAVSHGAMAKLRSHCSWRGNIRSLENVLAKAMTYSNGGLIRAEHILFDDMDALSDETFPNPKEPSTKQLSDEDLKILYEEVCVTVNEAGEKVGRKGSVDLIADALGFARETISRRLDSLECPKANRGRPSRKDREELKSEIDQWLRNKGITPVRTPK